MKPCKRLQAVGRLVASGSRIADIGTDHAKLPVWLVQEGVCPSCIASDVRPGPLDNARKTVREEHCEHLVELRLCDGLSGISPEEIDEIIIAGMGGELMIHIMEQSPWCKQKILLLQPMTAAEVLRDYLAQNRFEVLQELAVADMGKVYAVLQVKYNGVERVLQDGERYVGKIDPTDPDGAVYWNRQKQKLLRKREGLRRSQRPPVEEMEHLDAALCALERGCRL